MAGNEYTRYRAKNTDPDFKGSPRTKSDRWQLILERDVENPDFVPRDETTIVNPDYKPWVEQFDEDGNELPDTRTKEQKKPRIRVPDKRESNQKRRTKVEQRTKMYEGEPVTESKAKEAARLWMESENALLSRGDGAGMGVVEYIDEFIDAGAGNVEASTLKGYKNLLNCYIRPEFDGVALSDLTGKQINSWQAKLAVRGYSQATRVKAFRLLNLVCKRAVKVDDLDANPCDKADAPKQPDPDPNVLTEKSAKRLFELLSTMEPTPLAVATYLGVYMGLREGEICALQWKDVDETEMELRVHKSIGRGEGKTSTYVKATKTKKSKRDLPIPSPMMEVLQARKARMLSDLEQADMELDGEEFGDLYVIGYIDGRYKNPHVLSKEWKGFAEAFDLMGSRGRLCTFHDTRHTFATVAIKNNVDVKSVAEFLGHSDASMTLNVYADATKQMKRAAADVMGKAYE